MLSFQCIPCYIVLIVCLVCKVNEANPMQLTYANDSVYAGRVPVGGGVGETCGILLEMKHLCLERLTKTQKYMLCIFLVSSLGRVTSLASTCLWKVRIHHQFEALSTLWHQ